MLTRCFTQLNSARIELLALEIMRKLFVCKVTHLNMNPNCTLDLIYELISKLFISFIIITTIIIGHSSQSSTERLHGPRHGRYKGRLVRVKSLELGEQERPFRVHVDAHTKGCLQSVDGFLHGR